MYSILYFSLLSSNNPITITQQCPKGIATVELESKSAIQITVFFPVGRPAIWVCKKNQSNVPGSRWDRVLRKQNIPQSERSSLCQVRISTYVWMSVLYMGKCLLHIYLANFASRMNSRNLSVENSIILLYYNVKISKICKL